MNDFNILVVEFDSWVINFEFYEVVLEMNWEERDVKGLIFCFSVGVRFTVNSFVGFVVVEGVYFFFRLCVIL